MRISAAGLLLSLALAPSAASAQTDSDEWGNWLIYNGTFVFSNRWSVFTEAQLRLYELVSNPQEAFVRAAAHYNFNPTALVGLGYSHIWGWPFEEDTGEDAESVENRIYQQFAIKHWWGRAGFEHRYRLEQRWIQRAGETDYENRTRYRLQVTIPLNRSSMERGAFFVNVYDEIFIDIASVLTLDQNRLYAAAGYQFNPLANLQLGYLYNSKASANFHRLQIFLTWNFDFR
jgi:hypothetical protein